MSSCPAFELRKCEHAAPVGLPLHPGHGSHHLRERLQRQPPHKVNHRLVGGRHLLFVLEGVVKSKHPAHHVEVGLVRLQHGVHPGRLLVEVGLGKGIHVHHGLGPHGSLAAALQSYQHQQLHVEAELAVRHRRDHLLHNRGLERLEPALRVPALAQRRQQQALQEVTERQQLKVLGDAHGPFLVAEDAALIVPGPHARHP
mmetsp:Transcript_37150/g.61005  ORF Transcript_37150/g.61005 Transcript_37150/m.61005 type:complete len:200 (+) Transcript_37150:1137-1736(+)